MSAKVVHFELPADNVERARTFYKKTFQWGIQPMPEMNYTMVQTTPSDADGMPSELGGINGGIAARGNASPVKAPVITIAVDDIEQSLKQIGKNGGKTVQGKQAIGPMGFTAYFQDTEGNIVGLFQLPPA
ncbi:MAG: VOC family protein [Thermoplasmata archaeon]